MAGTDDATLLARGRADGEVYRFKGALKELPGAVFQSAMTPIERKACRSPAVSARAVSSTGSIRSTSACSMASKAPDRRHVAQRRPHPGRRRIVLLSRHLHVGERTLKGQILNQEHTPAKGENPVFGGHEVGIGFSGTCDEDGALLEATALAGKRSLRLTAVLKLMHRA